MAHDVKLNPQHGSMEARIAKRLRPSNEKATAAHTAVTGSGPQRVIHTIHHGGSQAAHGAGPLAPHGEDQ